MIEPMRRVTRALAATAALIVALSRMIPSPADVTVMSYDPARAGSSGFLMDGNQRFDTQFPRPIPQSRG